MTKKKRNMADIIIDTDSGKRYLWKEVTRIIKITEFLNSRSISKIINEF